MNKVLPIIVIYNIELKEAVSFQTLIRANGIKKFVVYDNSPKSSNQWKAYAPEAIYYSDTNNSGLSVAYNKGAGLARQMGYSHVLLLDQDTRFEVGAWQAYLEHLDYKGMLAPMMQTTNCADFSPVCINRLFTCAAHGLKPAQYSLYTYAVVNSGCCIPVDLFFRAGGYEDKVRLDFADFQFQLKMRRVCPCFLLINTMAVQDFSNDSRDISKVESRYKLYLGSARHYEADSLFTRIQHIANVLKHTLAITVRMRSMSFLRMFVTNYLIK